MRLAALALCLAAGTAAVVAKQVPGPEVVDTVARVGTYVEQYYARAQSIVAEESVTMQPLQSDLSAEGFARRLTYELRIDWKPDAPPEQRAVVVRELLKSAGPALGPPDQPDCMDPRAVSPEPLAFLLSGRREKFTYRIAGETRVDGRAAVMIDYKPVASEPPRVDWDRDCAQIDLPGRTAGRIWADSATSEILRYDEHIVGWTDIPGPRDRKHLNSPLWYTVERADTSIRYQTVTFADPEERLLLPSEIESVTVIRNSGLPRMRTTQTFSNYRRYVTGGRLVQ